MYNKEFVKIILINFLPVILVKMIFALINQNMQNQVGEIEEILKVRRFIGNIELFVDIIIVPIYLVGINAILYMKNSDWYVQEG